VAVALTVAARDWADHVRKKNCRDNPNCLFGLGEHVHGVWSNRPQLLHSMCVHPEGQRRQPVVEPAGLVNLGATCYVNVLLQCLFWNPLFRDAMYRWQPPTHAASSSSSALSPAQQEAAAKDVAVAALQKTFANLQFGVRRFASTVEFVEALQLPRSVQQDAEEFHKVLLNLLHERFVASPVSGVHRVIPGTFAGRLAYRTTCMNDESHVWYSPTEEFYELVSL
jgi:ubiquitin carboxyl-terminal hydrolase 48